MGNYEKGTINNNQFIQNIQYYANISDPVNNQSEIRIYSYSDVFLQQIIRYFSTKAELMNYQQFLTDFYSSQYDSKLIPLALQKIYYISAKKDIKLCSDINYSLQFYQQHFNYTLREHISCLSMKMAPSLAIGMKKSELLYIIRELVQIGAYMDHKQIVWDQLDTSSLFIDPEYQIKVPIPRSQLSTNLYRKITLFAPEQLNVKSNTLTMRLPLNISRVFSVGMIILECYSFLDSFVNYYVSLNKSSKTRKKDYIKMPNHIPNYQIDIKKLNNDIKNVKYNNLAAILSRMLQVDPSKRMTFDKLLQIIKKIDSKEFQNCLIVE